MEQLQGMDASFVAMETPSSPMHIGSILIYDPSTAPGGFVRFAEPPALARQGLQTEQSDNLVGAELAHAPRLAAS